MAEDSVIEYAPLLPDAFRESRLLPNILALATEDAEEQRMTAAKLLGNTEQAICQTCKAMILILDILSDCRRDILSPWRRDSASFRVSTDGSPVHGRHVQVGTNR